MYITPTFHLSKQRRALHTGSLWVSHAIGSRRGIAVRRGGSHPRSRRVDHGRSAGHTIPRCLFLTRVPLVHRLSHPFVSSLPSLGVFRKRPSASEIIALAVLLLPSSQAAHVTGGRLARGPQVRHDGQEEEDEDKRDGPFKSGGDRGDSVASRGRSAAFGNSVSATLPTLVSSRVDQHGPLTTAYVAPKQIAQATAKPTTMSL